MKIFSAITTCPRPDGISYLPATLASLHAAGFTPEIVNDPDKGGSWPALRRALAGLLERSEAADDCLIVFQDDVVAAKGLADWLQNNLWPGPVETIGVVSLYTAGPCHQQPGWFTTDDLGVHRTWGACALCLPRRSAELVLAYRERAMLNGSDTTLAGFFRSRNLKWFLHSPSLTNHVGAISSICVKEIGLDANRTAGNFCADVAELTD